MSVRHGWRDNNSAASTPRKARASAPGPEGKVTKKARTPRKKAKKEEDHDAVEVKAEEKDAPMMDADETEVEVEAEV